MAIVRRALDDFRALAIVALLLIPTEALHAQVLIGYLLGEKLSSPTFNMGFEVGINFATLDGLDGAERTTKTVFGLFADWRFSEHFHLTSAFLPFAGRGADGLDPVPTGDPAIDSQTQGGTMSRSMHLIEFPVLLKWAPKRNDGFRVGAGPSFGLITGANDRYESKTAAGTPYIVERDIGDQIPGLDFGMSFDIEYRLQFLSIAARYTHGLTDIGQSGSSGAVHSRTLTGTGRIYLGKKGKAPPK
jgi:Outer membrane protein beta-barrel domain